MGTAGQQSGDQSSQVAKWLRIRVNWEAKEYSHPIGRRLEALGCVRRGTGWMEGSPVSTNVIKSPVSPASQNSRNQEGSGVLPSCGQAPHTARGHDCCPGCTGSYSQPGCVPAGASPRVTSFQNRCGFWNEKKQEQLHQNHLPKMVITSVTHHNQPYPPNSL